MPRKREIPRMIALVARREDMSIPLDESRPFAPEATPIAVDNKSAPITQL